MYVVYAAVMNASAQGASPSAAKPQHVVKAWRVRWPGLPVVPPVRVSRAQLALAHDRDFVDRVLGTEQMREHDRLVFRTLHQRGTPVAWNLAGGYQRSLGEVVALHVNTMRECLAAPGEIRDNLSK